MFNLFSPLHIKECLYFKCLTVQKRAYVLPASLLMKPEIINRYFLLPATHVCFCKDRTRLRVYTHLFNGADRKSEILFHHARAVWADRNNRWRGAEPRRTRHRVWARSEFVCGYWPETVFALLKGWFTLFPSLIRIVKTNIENSGNFNVNVLP